jgi:hypothetical protein
MRSATIKTVIAAVLLWAIVADRSAAASRDVWLISTHGVCEGCPGALEGQPLQVWRLENECQWIAADLPTLLHTDDPAVPTVVFIPGYDSGPDDAVQMAWPIYGQLGGDAQGRPFRLLIWSWPAERSIPGIRADIQSKASRTDTEGILMAQLIDRIRPKVPLTLVGYSFGARIIGGALELLGGGQINGCGLARLNTAPRVPVRAMMVAAGDDADSLLPGHCHGQALSQVDQMFITINASDRVLKWYRRLYQARGPEALGYVGPQCAGCLGAEQAKLDLLDVTCAVGRNHHWDRYVACSGVLDRLGGYTFRRPPTAAAKTEKPAADQHKSVVAN